MSEVTFKNKDRILQYVKEAISLYDPGTTSRSGGNIFKFERIVYILGDMVTIQGFSENDDQKRGLILKGLARYSRYSKKTCELFKKALITEKRLRERNAPSRFFAIFPLNISYATLNKKRHFTVGRTKLRVRSLSYVLNNFDFRPALRLLRQSRRRIEGFISDFSYLIIEIDARSSIEAFWAAHRRLELFRALTNFTLSYGRISWQFGYPKCLGAVNPPKYMFVFNNERKFLNHWFSVGEFEQRLVRFEPADLQAIQRNLRYFEELREHNLKNILSNCLTVYAYALDEIEPGYIFLNLWQVLEIIALKDQSGITIDKVRMRIKAVFKNNPTIDDSLNALFHKRNRLVHEGRLGSFSLNDVNQIKGIAEGCIGFLFSQANRLKTTGALQEFYENIGQNRESIDKKLSILKYVKKVKAK